MFWDDNDSEFIQRVKNGLFLNLWLTDDERDRVMPVFGIIGIMVVIVLVMAILIVLVT